MSVVPDEPTAEQMVQMLDVALHGRSQTMPRPQSAGEVWEELLVEVERLVHPPRSHRSSPWVGADVIYQTDGRNGLRYHLPAKVTVTQRSHPGDYPCSKCGNNDVPLRAECPADGTSGCDRRRNPLPVPSSPWHVHLTVFTPGGVGTEVVRDEGFDSEEQVKQPRSEDFVGAFLLIPGSGTYVEHDVPFDVDGEPRSWRYTGELGR